MLWDVTPDIEGWEQSKEGDQKLLKLLWKKDKDGAWRMDLGIAITEEVDDGSDTEVELSMSSEGGGSNSVSESESELSMDSDSGSNKS